MLLLLMLWVCAASFGQRVRTNEILTGGDDGFGQSALRCFMSMCGGVLI